MTRLIAMDYADLELRILPLYDLRDMSLAQLYGARMTDPNFDYQSLALRTKSDQLFHDKVPSPLLMQLLERASKAAEDLDAVKKSLFYGKDLPPHLQLMADSLPPLPDQTDPQGVPTDALHAVIGIITEGGELADAAIKTLYEGVPFDLVNFQEELGDVAWYRAIGLAAAGQTIDQNDRQNIDKLQLRFPEKFDMNFALNRDLDAERKSLEGGARRQPEIDAILSKVSLAYRWGGGFVCLNGVIRDDLKGRFKDGDTVDTSELQSLTLNDAGQLIAKTRNTTYLVESLRDVAAS